MASPRGISQQLRDRFTGGECDFMNSLDIAGNYLDIKDVLGIFTALLKS